MSSTLHGIERDIENISIALSPMPNDHPSRPLLLACLGRAYVKRFEIREEPDDATKAIEYTTSALTLTPGGDPRLLSLLDTLGASYDDRFKRMGDLHDVEKSMEYKYLALALTPEGHPNLPDRLGALGVSYHNRFGRLGELHDLDTAIDYDSRALALTPDDHSNIPHRLYSLGASYGARFQRLGKPDDVEKWIKYTSRSVELTPDGDPQMSARLTNLGIVYSERFKILGELDDLQKSVKCHSRAIASTPDGHPQMPSRLASLAASHKNRYERVGDLDDLDKSIEYGSRALILSPTRHPLSPRWLANLGGSHSIRFQRLGEVGDLERAIGYHTRAVNSTPDGHPDLPHMLAALGLSHQNRYECRSRLDDLEKAIKYQSGGIALAPDGHPNLPGQFANLALSYKTRFDRLHNLEDLEKVLEHQACAVILTPDGHPDLSYRLNNLGITYAKRFQRCGGLDNLTKVVICFSKALAFTPDDHPDLSIRNHNLGQIYFLLGQQTGDVSYCQSALDCFRSATQVAAGHPRTMFNTALVWARLASEHDFLNPLEAYQTAINILPQFIWLGASTDQRYQDLKTAENLAVNAAYAAIRASDYGLALEWIEQARCVVWNQSLMLRSPLDKLRSSHPDLADRLETVSNRLQSVSFDRQGPVIQTSEQATREHHRLAKEYNRLLNEARSLPEFEDFLRSMNESKLATVPKTSPVVVINCHEDQCDALLILPGSDQIQHISLPDFSHDMAQFVWADMRKALAQKGLRERKPYFARQPGDSGGFEGGLQLIWYGIVSPILDYLGYMSNASTPTLPHITWCPTGPISFLPLHASGDYDHPQYRAYNYVVSSYTPTLAALLASNPNSLNASSKVLGICQEATPGHSPLPGTKKELECVRARTQKIAQYTALVNQDATPTAVLDAMEHHDWVHLACHAHQNVGNSTESGFFLQGGTMTLNSINRRSFKNKGLAFLSACQTAKGDEKLPDEAVHLASGMLMAGYTSVIGTMWSVHDDDAPLVADKVYEQLMKEGKVGSGEAGRALHYAVAELREQVGEREFGRWVPYIHIGS